MASSGPVNTPRVVAHFDFDFTNFPQTPNKYMDKYRSIQIKSKYNRFCSTWQVIGHSLDKTQLNDLDLRYFDFEVTKFDFYSI